MRIRTCILCAGLSAAAWAQDGVTAHAFSFQAQTTGHDDADYRNGLAALDAKQWEQAIGSFSASAEGNKANRDAALYWKAYAQNRAGRGQAALQTLAGLRERYPSSRWLKDARALELEVRTQTGQPAAPMSETDNDLKLMAINALMQSNPSAALPVLQKVLAGNGSEQMKEQALFVVAQSGSPEGNRLLSSIASGTSNPPLQIKAIHLMGMMGNDDSRKTLGTIYAASSDVQLKRAILQSFMQSGSRDFLLNAAKTEQNPELRANAIRLLAQSGGKDQLWQLYQANSTPADKKAILQSMFMTGDSSRLVEVARTESSPELRTAAIHSLGLMGENGGGATLVSIYEKDRDQEVKEAILNSLFLQQNGKALIQLAKREKDPEMKKRIVSKLSLIHSQDVTDYMMELLK